MNQPTLTAAARPAAAERRHVEEAVADLIAEAESARDPATRLDCLRQAALMYEKTLGDAEGALAIWQTAFADDPANEEMGLAVERVAQALGAWRTVLPEADALFPRLADNAQRVALSLWLARWHERYAQNLPEAERRLLEAEALAPGSAAVAEALSAFYAGRGDWRRAAEALESAARSATDPDETLGLLLEAARTYQTRAKDGRRAAELYQRVLALQPGNALAVEALGDLDPGSLCERYRRALERDQNDVAAIRQWADLAFTHQRWDDVRYLFEHVFSHFKGATPLPEKRESRAALLDGLDRCVAGQRWAQAVEILKTLARDESGAARAKYLVTAGKITQRELHDEAAAIALFNQALDTHPGDLKTFERLYALLAARRAWPEAEGNLRRMIERLESAGRGRDAGIMAPLWRRLAEVYRLGLRDLTRAAGAYERCLRLAPEDERARRCLAEIADLLPAGGGGQGPGAGGTKPTRV